MSLGEFELTGKETLVGAFSKRVDRRFAEQYPKFTIDLATLEFPEPQVLGDPSNRLSYAFSSDFPPEAESQYRELLKRVFPILYGHLGPPAETFNVYIENLGEYSDSFVVVDGGRTFLTDTSFIPRLITYEYVRSYPNDPASIQLLEEKPYQYWSSKTVNYDAIKNLRWTGAGDFWNPPSGAANRYSIAATTVQMLIRENPNFMREFLSLYYETIREDTDWRPNRNDLVAMWETLAPELSGYPLVEYLDTLPVFIRDHGRR